MPRVEMARHLFRFFPGLEGKEISVEGATVADVVSGLEALAPGLADYLTDERGRMRPHVNIFVGNELIEDRDTLSDRVEDGAVVYVMQALSGG